MKKNIVYIILILALIITTGVNVVNRMIVEKSAKEVEITLDYSQMSKLSNQSGKSLESWFTKFKSLGANSVSITEESISSLIEEGFELEAEVLINLKKDTLWKDRYPKDFIEYINKNEYDTSDVVIVSSDLELKKRLIEGISVRYSNDFYTIFDDSSDLYAILLDGEESELLYSVVYKEFYEDGDSYPKEHKKIVGSVIYYIGIGFAEEKIEAIKNSGLLVNLRPSNNILHTDKLVEAFEYELEKYNITPKMMLFTSKSILGYPDNALDTYDLMDKYDIPPVLIETSVQRSNIEQEGLNEMVKFYDYQSVRLLAIDGWMQEKYKAYNYSGAEEIENIIFRAVSERNIRLIYFRPFKINHEKFVTDFEEYEKSFERISDRLEVHGMKLGEFSLMKSNDDSLVTGIITGLGLISIVILMLRNFINFSSKIEYVLLVLGGICVSGVLMYSPNLGRQVLALIGTLVVSSIGAFILVVFAKEKYINQQIFKTREILIKAAIMTFALGFLAMFGGLIVAGLLSHSKYLLEMEFFRGVKISEILPMIVFLGLYILKFGYKRSKKEIKENNIMYKDIFELLKLDIKLIYIILAGVAGAVLYIYIARSGHETTIQPSNLEMIFRNFLELKLLARPRLKEFLFAIPSLMVFIYIAFKAYKPLIWIVGIPAVITFTSIINTFCHLRTPLYLSIVRTFLSLGIGIIIGALLILLIELVIGIVNKVINHNKNNKLETE